MEYVQTVFFAIRGILRYQCLRYQELTILHLTFFRKPPAPKKPVTPESVSDDESFKMSESDDDSDFGVKKKKAPAKAPAAK